MARSVVDLEIADSDIGFCDTLRQNLHDNCTGICRYFIVHEVDPVLIVSIGHLRGAANTGTAERVDGLGLTDEEGSLVVGWYDVDEEGQGGGVGLGCQEDGVEFDAEVVVLRGDCESLSEGVAEYGQE